MNKQEDTSRSLNSPKLSFPGFLSLLLEGRRFIITNVLVVTILATIVSFVLPKWYRATASLLPPKQPDLFGALGSVSNVLRGIPGAIRLGGQRNSGYNYFAILKSRTALESVVEKFNLIQVYGVADSSMELAIKELEGNVSFEETNNDDIVIQVLDRDPQRAADMANYFVEILNEISIRMGTMEARSNREFIEKRVEDSRAGLKLAEDQLRAYQEKSGLIITPEQSSSVSAVGGLYAARTKKEVELAILRRQATSENPAVKQLEAEVGELSRKISAIPEAGMTSLRLYREVVIQQKILEFLVPLYEQARIDEQKDMPVLLLLDKAVPPERKDRPKRVIIVVTAFILSFLAGVGVLLLRNAAAQQSRLGGSDMERLLSNWAETKREMLIVRRRGRGRE